MAGRGGKRGGSQKGGKSGLSFKKAKGEKRKEEARAEREAEERAAKERAEKERAEAERMRLEREAERERERHVAQMQQETRSLLLLPHAEQIQYKRGKKTIKEDRFLDPETHGFVNPLHVLLYRTDSTRAKASCGWNSFRQAHMLA